MNTDDWTYCPRCGENLILKPAYDGKERPTCDACGFIYFADPKVTAGVLLEDDWGRVLLGKRSVDPRMGYWAIPSGYIDYGEAPDDAARRELYEETGLDVELTGLLGVWSFDDDIGEKAGIAIFYRGVVVAGTLAPADDIEKAVWFTTDDLPAQIAFPVHRDVLTLWKHDELQTVPV